MRILSLDPGHTTGFCVLTIDKKIPKLSRVGECKDPTLEELEDEFKNCDVIVCEDFLVDPRKSQAGAFDRSRMQTIQVIGSVQTLARINQKRVVLQLNNVKPVGYGFANLVYRRGAKGVHIQDAIAHVMYYSVRNGLCLPLKDKL